MAREGQFAIRSSSTLHIDDEMIALEEKERAQAEKERDEELAVLSSIAVLNDHPGYEQIRKLRQTTINHYRSGEFLRTAALDSSIPDDLLGQQMRVGLLVADELEKELLTVESAVETVEQEKAVKRERSRRP